ncbi:AbiH family protein [Clostridium beijerinckii]|uniref:AbiH family protein n=1 Tax=Clostridium beijerinckii TaxID=1520 RepID=UPI00242ED9EE|nr:AbiH family protein [Clostridium beijerinckii]MDG5852448.1 AbiH family protein [Clostridium beijerinckii]
MKILVIGNGFDLEHGLPTKYKDFLDFMQGIYLINLITSISDKGAFIAELERTTKHKVDENIKKYFTQEKFLDPDLIKEWKEEKISKELIDGANNNIWIKYFIENMNYEKEGWIDLESEISNVIKCLEYSKNLSNYLKKFNEWPADRDREVYKEKVVEKIIKFSELKIQFFELVGKNLENIINTIIKHLNNLIVCLEIYLVECVGNMDVKDVAPDIKENHCDKVLSFNYSDTHHRLYDIYPTNPKEYDYIHGKANITREESENNMVLGIDEYLDSESKNKELEFIAFKKYFQRIYKKTGNEYKKWIKQIEDSYKEKLEKEVDFAKTVAKTDEEIFEEALVSMNKNHKNQIYIFGHSLDITDKDIIKELIECPDTETTIFYYDKDVYAQQIANMVKIIGQDELIKRVSGANPTIIFKQQQQRINRD